MLQTNNPRSKTGYGLAIFILCITSLMSAIDTSIINIGVPTIEKALNTDFSSVQWVILSYLLAVTSLIVGIGRIGDIFGKKKLYIFGIGLFTVTSLLCGASVSIYELIVFRAFQGMGGAILIALSFAIVGDIVPKEKIINSMTAITSTLPIGFALGPSIGGLMINFLGWRSLFFLNVPIGVIAFLLALKLPDIPVVEKVQKLDVFGMLVLAITLVGYLLSITLAENQGMSRNVIFLFAATVIGIVVFIVVEKKTAAPLVHLDMFKDAVFSVSLIVSVIIYATINGYGFILPFYLEQAKSFSTSLSGLVLMAGPVGCAIFTPVAGGAVNRFGNAKVMTFGILMIAIGVFFMSSFRVYTSISTIAVTLFLCNGSLAFFQTPNNAFIMTLAKPEQRGLTSGILNLSRTIGQTTGTAVIGAIFYFFNRTNSITTANSESIVVGMSHTFLVEVLIMTCALLLGLIAYRPWDPVKRH